MPYIEAVSSQEIEGDLVEVHVTCKIDQRPVSVPYRVLIDDGLTLKALVAFQSAARSGELPLSCLERELIDGLTCSSTGCAL